MDFTEDGADGTIRPILVSPEEGAMKFFLAIIGCAALAVSASAQGRGMAAIPERPQQQSFDTSKGPVKITPLYNASMLIEIPGTQIYVDLAKPVVFDDLPVAHFLLITDTNPGHMDADAIDAVSSAGARGTRVVAPAAVLKDPKVSKTIEDNTSGAKELANGESDMVDHRNGWTVEAAPMYTVNHKMPNGQPYYPKGRGNGYILTFGDKRFYFSGDTEGTPEMRSLKNIDVAFVCMNAHTMSPEEAADAVKAFHPKVVIPYDYQGSDPQIFAKALEGTGIEVRLLDWYSDKYKK
jgi:L-ascorbate metabolism protein UlaG (beta-lactamase superfamily)